MSIIFFINCLCLLFPFNLLFHSVIFTALGNGGMSFRLVAEVFGHLLGEEVAVELVAGLADGQAAAVLVEHLDFLVGEVVGAVAQLARAVEVVALDVLEGFIAKTYGGQAAADEVFT